jgi:hypothetical protein
VAPVKIYWDDLMPEKQAELLQLLGHNGNYDVFPLLEIEAEDPMQANVENEEDDL